MKVKWKQQEKLFVATFVGLKGKIFSKKLIMFVVLKN